MEQQLRLEELSFGLQNVKFESFERGVKRFGYTNNITEECLQGVAQETGLNPAKFVAGTLV